MRQFVLEVESMPNNTVKGQLKYPVIGEVHIRPTDFRDSSLQQDASQEQVQIEKIDYIVYDPGFVKKGEEVVREMEIRQAWDKEKLQKEILAMFMALGKGEGLKVYEVANRLDQPVNPVKATIERLCEYDNLKKFYVLKRL